MENMGSDNYPQLSPRTCRTRLIYDQKIISNLLGSDNKLIYIDSSGFFHYGEMSIDIKAQTDIEHQIVLHNGNAVIFPEKIRVNLSNNSFESLEYYCTASTKYGSLSYSSFLDSTKYEYAVRCSIDKVALNTTVSVRSKVGTIDVLIDFTDIRNQKITTDGTDDYEWLFKKINVGDCIECAYGAENDSVLYMCTSVKDADVSGVYYENKIRTFTEITNYYVRIQAHDLDKSGNLKVGDYIKISGIENSMLSGWSPHSSDMSSCIQVLNENYFKIYAKLNSDTIIIKASIKSSVPYTGSVTIERALPELDEGMVIEVGNRLWSCSSKNNEIYCCKLGDPTNWYAYQDAIASDSFAASVGCEGEFTGIARQNDSVIFFKENWVIKIFGNKPSNYTLNKYNVSGVEKGSRNSIVWLNGVLFYKSREGIMQYSPSSQPQLISESLGTERYTNAIAGRHENKYYISMFNNSTDKYELFCFDINKGLWHKEDDTQMLGTVTYNDIMYYIDGKTDYLMTPETDINLLDEKVNQPDESEIQREADFEWSCQTGDLYDSDFDTKIISRLQIGLKPHRGTEIKVMARFEDGGQLYELAHMRYKEKRAETIPIAVRRAEFLQLVIKGKGYAEIYGISITYAKGSDKKNGSI